MNKIFWVHENIIVASKNKKKRKVQTPYVIFRSILFLGRKCISTYTIGRVENLSGKNNFANFRKKKLYFQHTYNDDRNLKNVKETVSHLFRSTPNKYVVQVCCETLPLFAAASGFSTLLIFFYS